MTARQRPVRLLFEPGLRAALLGARLAAVGIPAPLCSSWPPEPDAPAQGPGAGTEAEGDLLLLADVALVGAIEAPGRIWIEAVGDEDDEGTDAARARLGRCRLVDPSLDAKALARVVAKDDAVGAAIDPHQWATLQALADQAPDRVAALIEGYLARSADRLRELQALRAEGDWTALGQQAHGWKGAAASLGADRLAAALQRLELWDGREPPDPDPVLAVVATRAAAAAAALEQRLAVLA